MKASSMQTYLKLVLSTHRRIFFAEFFLMWEQIQTFPKSHTCSGFTRLNQHGVEKKGESQVYTCPRQGLKEGVRVTFGIGSDRSQNTSKVLEECEQTEQCSELRSCPENKSVTKQEEKTKTKWYMPYERIIKCAICNFGKWF